MTLLLISGMGRRPIEDPVRKRNIQVSETFWRYALRYRSENEPMYNAMDRLLNYYIQNKDDIVQDNEQKVRTIAKLYERIHLLEAQLKGLEYYK